MESTGKQEMRIAVKCKQCNMTIFYKTTPSTGIIECKCPRCRKITEINLAYRRSKHRYSTANQRIIHYRLPFFNIRSQHRATGYAVTDRIMKHHQIAGHETMSNKFTLSYSCPAFIFSKTLNIYSLKYKGQRIQIVLFSQSEKRSIGTLAFMHPFWLHF